MFMKTITKVSLFLAFLLIAVSCSMPVTKVDVQSMEIVSAEQEQSKAISMLTNILVDRGYDIKMSNERAGLVTTEYKKFASVGDNPPFDMYMQIRGTVRNKLGKTSIKLSPLVKQQNRMNSAAFTEEELNYYTGNPKNVKQIKSMKENTGWRSLAQTNFMNVVSDVAEAFGISLEDVKQNVTKTEVNALKAN